MATARRPILESAIEPLMETQPGCIAIARTGRAIIDGPVVLPHSTVRPLRSPSDIGGSLPDTFRAAATRGIAGRCPRCGQGPLFSRFLKPEARCAACGQDWTHQRADDFPAYIAILLTGHILAPIIIWLVSDYDLSPAVLAAIILPLAVTMMISMLQPAKGAVIALQWWHGLNGFVRERADAS